MSHRPPPNHSTEAVREALIEDRACSVTAVTVAEVICVLKSNVSC